MAAPPPRGTPRLTDPSEAMSSPDPLNASRDSAILPSSRRVTRSITRSQTTQRLMTFSRESSPLKQTIELDIGNTKSPRKVRVTVEAEEPIDEEEEAGKSAVRTRSIARRLFPASTPATKKGAVTTTVPLRDDEPTAITPSRQGRPKRAAATPYAEKSARASKRVKTTNTPAKDTTDSVSKPTRKATPGRRATKKASAKKTPARRSKRTASPDSTFPPRTTASPSSPQPDTPTRTPSVNKRKVQEAENGTNEELSSPVASKKRKMILEAYEEQDEQEPSPTVPNKRGRGRPRRVEPVLEDVDQLTDATAEAQESPALETTEIGDAGTAEELAVAQESPAVETTQSGAAGAFKVAEEMTVAQESPVHENTESGASGAFDAAEEATVAQESPVNENTHSGEAGALEAAEEHAEAQESPAKESTQSGEAGTFEVAEEIEDVVVVHMDEPDLISQPSEALNSAQEAMTSEPDLWLALPENNDSHSHDDRSPSVDSHPDEDLPLPVADTDVATTSDAPEEATEQLVLDDTVAQGEDFSMIFADSIPSLQGRSGVQPTNPEDVGEETSLIINRTLESLRQSRNGEEEIANKNTAVAAHEEAPRAATPPKPASPPEPASAPVSAAVSRRVSLLQTQAAVDDDSFSSVDTEIFRNAIPEEFRARYAKGVFNGPLVSYSPLAALSSRPASGGLLPPDERATPPPPPPAAESAKSTSQSQLQAPQRSSSSVDTARPSLSPIVRAGIALQGVTSDASSPQSGRGSLGSPFRPSTHATPVPDAATPTRQVAPAETGSEGATGGRGWLPSFSSLVQSGIKFFSPTTVAANRANRQEERLVDEEVESEGVVPMDEEEDLWAFEARRDDNRPDESPTLPPTKEVGGNPPETAAASSDQPRSGGLSSFFSSPTPFPAGPNAREIIEEQKKQKILDRARELEARAGNPGTEDGRRQRHYFSQPLRPFVRQQSSELSSARPVLQATQGRAAPQQQQQRPSTPPSASSPQEASSTPVRSRELRPLPDKNASPTKSCLRSPLKPHVKGRLVAFDRDVVSPLAQREARLAGVDNPAAVEAQQSEEAAAFDHRGHRPESEDVEMTDVSDVELSPSEYDVERPQSLSKTVWTDAHWQRLAEIVEERRRGTISLPTSFTSRSRWLVGQTVYSHGEKLRLNPWHVSVIDTFNSRVGGVWDEESLAKRLFSLLVAGQLKQERREPKEPYAHRRRGGA